MAGLQVCSGRYTPSSRGLLDVPPRAWDRVPVWSDSFRACAFFWHPHLRTSSTLPLLYEYARCAAPAAETRE